MALTNMMLIQTRLVKICDKIIYIYIYQISNMSNILSELIIGTSFIPLKIGLQGDRGVQ
jgi:Na+-transporting NADH:ubiquinone oxidoreductase subunit NqrD